MMLDVTFTRVTFSPVPALFWLFISSSSSTRVFQLMGCVASLVGVSFISEVYSVRDIV
ncbi:hypothetical protein BC827DRAFT_1185415 [Russula dissimulans]|jgi:hypothetical protein|nr:hypothetical protein BC827DRAFT_1185415 [Russula dissimulans]